jgi:hypothetical protein
MVSPPSDRFMSLAARQRAQTSYALPYLAGQWRMRGQILDLFFEKGDIPQDHHFLWMMWLDELS